MLSPTGRAATGAGLWACVVQDWQFKSWGSLALSSQEHDSSYCFVVYLCSLMEAQFCCTQWCSDTSSGLNDKSEALKIFKLYTVSAVISKVRFWDFVNSRSDTSIRRPFLSIISTRSRSLYSECYSISHKAISCSISYDFSVVPVPCSLQAH